jgi:hypothetical protein
VLLLKVVLLVSAGGRVWFSTEVVGGRTGWGLGLLFPQKVFLRRKIIIIILVSSKIN